jgi:outer membrane protein OmpA-like peptidoglycan-associated protein
MTSRISTIALGLIVTAGGGTLFTGCASMNNKERGAVIGAGAGAAVGGIIGNQTGSTARGAIIGAVVGGVAGGIIGHQMDQQAKEIKQQIPGAVVERVGEGIQVTFDSGLLFDYDSDRIKPAAAENLRNLAQSLNQYPNTDLVIVGHTDNIGSDSYNEDLSRRRARAAANYLASLGVNSNRLRTYGRGENEPVAENASDAGRQQNRRVEVAIFANAAAREEARRRAATGN